MGKKPIKYNTSAQYVIGLCRSLQTEDKTQVRNAITRCIHMIIDDNKKHIPSCHRELESVVYKYETFIHRLECDVITLCPTMRLYDTSTFKTRYNLVLGHCALSQFMSDQKQSSTLSSKQSKQSEQVVVLFEQSSWVKLNIRHYSKNEMQLVSEDDGVRWTIEIKRRRHSLHQIRITLDYLFLYAPRDVPSKEWFHKDKTCKRFVYSYILAMMDVFTHCAPSNTKIVFTLQNEAMIPKRAPFQEKDNVLEGMNLTALRVSQGLPDLYESLGFYTASDVQMLCSRIHNTRSCLSQFDDHRKTYELRQDIVNTVYGKKNVFDNIEGTISEKKRVLKHICN